MVDAFHAAALRAGGSSDGAPGLRPEYFAGYYAAFIRDPDGNRIEAITFVEGVRALTRRVLMLRSDEARVSKHGRRRSGACGHPSRRVAPRL